MARIRAVWVTEHPRLRSTSNVASLRLTGPDGSVAGAGSGARTRSARRGRRPDGRLRVRPRSAAGGVWRAAGPGAPDTAGEAIELRLDRHQVALQCLEPRHGRGRHLAGRARRRPEPLRERLDGRVESRLEFAEGRGRRLGLRGEPGLEPAPGSLRAFLGRSQGPLHPLPALGVAGADPRFRERDARVDLAADELGPGRVLGVAGIEPLAERDQLLLQGSDRRRHGRERPERVGDLLEAADPQLDVLGDRGAAASVPFELPDATAQVVDEDLDRPHPRQQLLALRCPGVLGSGEALVEGAKLVREPTGGFRLRRPRRGVAAPGRQPALAVASFGHRDDCRHRPGRQKPPG